MNTACLLTANKQEHSFVFKNGCVQCSKVILLKHHYLFPTKSLQSNFLLFISFFFLFNPETKSCSKKFIAQSFPEVSKHKEIIFQQE